jgi:uncharacterized membrane protein
MSTLTVLKFSTPEGAEHALKTLKGLQEQQLITIEDAATVSWPQGKKGPKTHQAANMAGIGALDGAFWGMLFGLLFFVPFLGLAIGAGIGALTGKFSDFGIDDKFIKQVQSQVVEGTSALFLLSSNAVVDRVIEAFKDNKPEIISTNLSADKEAELKEAFSHA